MKIALLYQLIGNETSNGTLSILKVHLTGKDEQNEQKRALLTIVDDLRRDFSRLSFQCQTSHHIVIKMLIK